MNIKIFRNHDPNSNIIVKHQWQLILISQQTKHYSCTLQNLSLTQNITLRIWLSCESSISRRTRVTRQPHLGDAEGVDGQEEVLEARLPGGAQERLHGFRAELLLAGLRTLWELPRVARDQRLDEVVVLDAAVGTADPVTVVAEEVESLVRQQERLGAAVTLKEHNTGLQHCSSRRFWERRSDCIPQKTFIASKSSREDHIRNTIDED